MFSTKSTRQRAVCFRHLSFSAAAAAAAAAAAGAGLYPTDDLEAAKCDAIIDSAVDFGINVLPSMRESDEAKKVANPPHAVM